MADVTLHPVQVDEDIGGCLTGVTAQNMRVPPSPDCTWGDSGLAQSIYQAV